MQFFSRSYNLAHRRFTLVWAVLWQSSLRGYPWHRAQCWGTCWNCWDGFAKTSAFVSGPRPTTYDSVQTLLQSFFAKRTKINARRYKSKKRQTERGSCGEPDTLLKLVWEVLHQLRWAGKAFWNASSPSPCRTWRERLFVCTLWCFVKTRLATTDTANHPSIAGMLANKTPNSDPTSLPRTLVPCDVFERLVSTNY